MKCFITGGAGFIGSNLVDYLISKGHSVTVYDNLSSGKKAFIHQHYKNPNFKFVKSDLLEKKELVKAMKSHDIVFHFAANPDVLKGLEEPTLDFETGTLATFNVLDAMRINKIKKIVFSSSGTVYGYTEKLKVKEDYGPILPVSLYGANKVAAEALISGFANIFGFTAYILRFANIVGKRQTHGVIYDFIKKLKKNPKKLLILGDGNQTKHYLLIEDLLESTLFVLDNAKDQINYYNISNDSAIDVTTLAKMVIAEMGLSDVKLEYSGGKQGWKGDVPISFLSSEKINKLGWNAKYDSQEALIIAIKTLKKDLL